MFRITLPFVTDTSIISFQLKLLSFDEWQQIIVKRFKEIDDRQRERGVHVKENINKRNEKQNIIKIVQ